MTCTTDGQARQQVLERLTTADLPQGVQPQLAPLSTAIGEIYRYTLKAPGYTTRDLRTLEDWVVERNFRMWQVLLMSLLLAGLLKRMKSIPASVGCATMVLRCSNFIPRWAAGMPMWAAAR